MCLLLKERIACANKSTAKFADVIRCMSFKAGKEFLVVKKRSRVKNAASL
jgi:hypothetical protein